MACGAGRRSGSPLFGRAKGRFAQRDPIADGRVHEVVVELRGFEPLTPCMPCKCSARLSYSPICGRQITKGARITGKRLSVGPDRLTVGEPRSVPPQSLQAVVVPLFRLEQVDDHVAVIEEYPLRLFHTLPP